MFMLSHYLSFNAKKVMKNDKKNCFPILHSSLNMPTYFLLCFALTLSIFELINVYHYSYYYILIILVNKSRIFCYFCCRQSCHAYIGLISIIQSDLMST